MDKTWSLAEWMDGWMKMLLQASTSLSQGFEKQKIVDIKSKVVSLAFETFHNPVLILSPLHTLLPPGKLD